MAEMENNGIDPKYAYLKQLSMERLENLLSRAAIVSRNEDDEYFDAIEEVILQKRREDAVGRATHIDSSWEEFKKHYATPEGQGMLLYPDEESDKSSYENHNTSNPFPSQNKTIKRILKKAVMVAAIIAAFFGVMVVAQAAGMDVFGTLARWTEETFHFQTGTAQMALPAAPPEDIQDEYYNTIQAEVEKCGISRPVVPTQYPIGYTLESHDYSENATGRFVSCLFQNDEGDEFIFVIANYTDNERISSLIFEKDESAVEEYISNVIRFYIMSNRDNVTATSAENGIYLNISGTLTIEELKTMIDSIGGYDL